MICKVFELMIGFDQSGRTHYLSYHKTQKTKGIWSSLQRGIFYPQKTWLRNKNWLTLAVQYVLQYDIETSLMFPIIQLIGSSSYPVSPPVSVLRLPETGTSCEGCGIS